jgi:hypothetical protein
MVVAGVILVEIKASGTIEKYAEAQILNSLKAAGGGIGLLLNFGRADSIPVNRVLPRMPSVFIRGFPWPDPFPCSSVGFPIPSVSVRRVADALHQLHICVTSTR